MIGRLGAPAYQEAIAASWQRCERQHNLLRDASWPIMRLQASEIAPRLEQIVEQTGGRQGFFRQLAAVAGQVGHCLVVTDAEGVLIRLETGTDSNGPEEWNGISLGSCWDERIAGTNGVSMALRSGHAFTVRGADHFYSQLRQYACTGVPVLDANGAAIGSVNLVSIDRGNRSDYLFGQQLLATAAQRIQRNLFARQFSDAMMVTVSLAGQGDVLTGDALIAVDEAGIILGATSAVEKVVGHAAASTLKGQAFQAIFDLDSEALAKVPDRVLSMPARSGKALNFSIKLPGKARQTRPAAAIANTAHRSRPLPPSLRQMATGSHAMAALCRHAEAAFRRGSPLLLEGETGTGKTAMIAALQESEMPAAQMIQIDGATLGQSDADREHLQMILGQARAIAAQPDPQQGNVTLVFDNVDELPDHAQAELRRHLDQMESHQPCCAATGRLVIPRLVCTSKKSLFAAVEQGRFRDDLLYLLTVSHITLPPLRRREHPEVLAQVLASQIAGRKIEFSDEAVAAIRHCNFPGNLRELRNALERALMLMQGDRLSAFDLRDTSIATHTPASRPASAPSEAAPRLTYDERTLILDALENCRWNVSQAARKLGMGRATIHRKMKHHGIIRAKHP
ncbi:sigma 54-interacting transcriptional regulator [Paracoccus sp. Z330]|uniref:Sigma 54-interacting transcriptional regulator n=1 Tax=Paracoccus onchidii TaxID=3017813 RepID=A0ABT4ZCF2_9RHOB|nr:sigma 54-interacting transcriptional regulator [Paracoccus onchidii]MDB6176325.1 sigma 54-interacting transcriptional regulator [Paracoccus onchidii]